MLNVEYLLRDSISRACEDLPDILRAAEELFDPLEEEPAGLSKAVRSFGLATILGSIFFEIVLHNLAHMKPGFVDEWKEERKLITHEADLIRIGAAEILAGTSLPLSAVNKRWQSSLILSVSTIVRFCGLSGRSEDADRYLELLRSAVEFRV